MASKDEIRRRLKMLRTEMAHAEVDFYIAYSTDSHASEYVSDYYKVTEYLTGCTSDNVVLIVDQGQARLWTDGRFFISAAAELEGTGVELMKEGEPDVPTPYHYLKDQLEAGSVLGFDGTCVSAQNGEILRSLVKSCGAKIESTPEIISEVWVGRPALPSGKAWILPDELAGRSCDEKLSDVRRKMEELGCTSFVLSKLDDIMWLLNIRGSDVAYNPVVLTYLLVGMDTADLFIQDEAVTEELNTYVREHRIKLHAYDDIFKYIRDYHFEGAVLFDSTQSSDAMETLLRDKSEVVDAPNPTTLMKAVKNEVEIQNSRHFYLLDSVAVCRFVYLVKNHLAGKLNEVTAAGLIDSLRSKIPGYIDLSFPTISAVGAHAAMAHYAPDEKNAGEVGDEGFLLVDSGAHYQGATTDETRTIALGHLTDEMKRDFTLVAVSNLALMYAKYARGTTGGQLDMIAREPLYRHGMNFNHGTGHGVGYILNVHEGPQRISRGTSYGTGIQMEPGMITSDEPGIYREGKYGIRTESIMLTVADETTEFGEFLRSEPLTFVPIDLDAIDTRYMEPIDIERLNDYHRRVREAVSPYLSDDERAWLVEATRSVTR